VTSYTVKTEIFEGPLDLLLQLIEKRKLFINDISLSQVADDYIAYLQQAETFPVDESADFIVIASTLLLIKSKSLLPKIELSEEETGSIEDLEHRLKEYQKIKKLSVHIDQLFGSTVLFSKNKRSQHTTVFSPTAEIEPRSLLEIAERLITQLPVKEIKPKVTVQKVISLEEMIEGLTKRIQSGLRMSFSDFSKKGKAEKVNVIVSFLAVLELVKQGLIQVRQNNPTEDIEIETSNITIPHYN